MHLVLFVLHPSPHDNFDLFLFDYYYLPQQFSFISLFLSLFLFSCIWFVWYYVKPRWYLVILCHELPWWHGHVIWAALYQYWIYNIVHYIASTLQFFSKSRLPKVFINITYQLHTMCTTQIHLPCLAFQNYCWFLFYWCHHWKHRMWWI